MVRRGWWYLFATLVIELGSAMGTHFIPHAINIYMKPPRELSVVLEWAEVGGSQQQRHSEFFPRFFNLLHPLPILGHVTTN